MSLGQLLEQLEILGTIDPNILRKIRQQIENPNKTVKPKAVLSYLIKKNQITESQATQILKGELLPPADVPTVDEFEVDEPPAENDYDTGELIGLAPEPEETPPPAPIVAPPIESEIETPVITPSLANKATIADAQEFENLNDDIVEVDLQEAVEPETYADYDAGTLDDSFASAAEPESKIKSSISFRGKKDRGDQWSTKWLYIGFGILGFLIIMLALLYIATMGVKAEEQWAAANDSFEKLAYLDAAKKYEEYYIDNPSHEHVSEAKALRAQALIASAFAAKNWTETISSAESLLPPLMEDEDSKIEQIRDDLAYMLPEALMKITEEAKKARNLADMEQEMAKSLQLKTVIDNNVYIPTSRRKKPVTAANLAKIDNNLGILKVQIDKEKDYNAAIAEIKQLGVANETDKAFAIYKKLTRNYGDLAGRMQLRNTMLEISSKERELVKPIVDKLPVANAARFSPIKNTVMLASRVGKPVENLQDEIINFLADGSVYGIRVSDGTLLWRQFVGFQTSIQPALFDLDSLLVSDLQNFDLMLANQATGEIRWRTEIGESFLAPAFNSTMIVVTTNSGKVIQISPESGEVIHMVQLPQAANVPALVAERDPYIYQVGSYSNLYVLSSQDLSCREVHYLGHYAGSVAISPQAWLGYILVAVNGGNSCDLMVLKPAQNGLELQLVQVMNQITTSPVTTPIQRLNRWVLLTADNGEIRILELLPNEDLNPVTRFASDRFENSSGHPTYVLTEGSNLWIASLGISRFRIRRTQGTFQRDEIIDHADTFLTPLRKLDDHLFHVRRRRGSGMLSASLVDSTSLAPIWRTDFGGQSVGSPQRVGESLVAVSNQGDVFNISATEITAGYADVVARASTVVEDLKFETLVRLPDDTFVVMGSAPQEDFLLGKTSPVQSKLMRLSPPANHPACPPIAIGENLVVPSFDGQVTILNPKNGRLVGTPFQPPISPGKQTEWIEPTLIRDRLFAIASGKGSGSSSDNMLYLLDAENFGSVNEVGSLKADEPFKSRLVNDGRSIFAITAGAAQDSINSFTFEPQLAPSTKIALPGRVVAGPWQVEDGLLLKMDNDQLLLLASDLSTKWSLSIPNDRLAAAPEQVGSNILVSMQNGTLLTINPTTGEIAQQTDLRQPISSAPTRDNQTLYFSGLDGTVHEVDFNKIPGVN